MTQLKDKGRVREKKTVESLDTFIRMIILGFLANPYHRNIGEEMKKLYEERYGND